MPDNARRIVFAYALRDRVSWGGVEWVIIGRSWQEWGYGPCAFGYFYDLALPALPTRSLHQVPEKEINEKG